jgi:hypothetical protein
MLSVYKFLAEELSDFSSYLQPTLDRKSPVELRYSKDQTDIIRLNAFKIISTPHTVYQFEAKIGGISEVKDVIAGTNNVIATRVLKSPDLSLRCETKNIHPVRVLPLGNEFCQFIALRATQKKIGKAMA